MTDSPVEGVERRNGHGSKLASLVSGAVHAVSTFAFQYGRHDYGVLSSFFGEHKEWSELTDIDGPSIIEGRISIAKKPHYTVHDIDMITDVSYEIMGDRDDPNDGVDITYPCDRKKETRALRRLFAAMRRTQFGKGYSRVALLPRRGLD